MSNFPNLNELPEASLTKQRLINERTELLAVALEANEKKAVGRMRDADGGRCCLCVAQDVAVANGADLSPHDGGSYTFYPPAAVFNWFGWDRPVPKLIYDASKPHDVEPADTLNDGGTSEEADGTKYTHKEIAAMFRRTFIKPLE